MTAGRLIAVVGPSGVGKDSVMVGIVASDPTITLVRRTVTRPPGLGGEDYDAVTPSQFQLLISEGAFCVHWPAHGMSYGVPIAVLQAVNAGGQCLVNFSRSALSQAAEIFPDMVVLKLTAQPETLSKRLATRGRESAVEIAKRLAQAQKPLPVGLNVLQISNDGPLETTVASALAALQPVRA